MLHHSPASQASPPAAATPRGRGSRLSRLARPSRLARLARFGSLLSCLGATAATGAANGQLVGASLAWRTIDGGGALHAAGGEYSLSFTIGQPDAARRRVSGVHALAPGFWGAACPFEWCPGDFDLDRDIDGEDLGHLLATWGAPGIADLDGSGLVDGSDLGILLGMWGACP